MMYGPIFETAIGFCQPTATATPTPPTPTPTFTQTPTPTPTDTPVPVSVGTDQDGFTFTADDRTYTSRQTFNWAIGSTHRIATTSPQVFGSGGRRLWTGWSDGGDLSHTVLINRSAIYTANFDRTQYFLSVISYPPGYGTTSPMSDYYDAGQSIQINAVPYGGPPFIDW